MSNPFTDPAQHEALYGNSMRLSRRSSALMRAKTAGRFVPSVIAQLVREHGAEAGQTLGLVADIGCGSGTVSHALADRLRPKTVVGVDASYALVTKARLRAARQLGTQMEFVQGDFHQLPFPDDACDLVVAPFCLYHSPTPERVIRELNRALSPSGLAVLVTKAADSYRELDRLIATAGLDPWADQRESLYATAHGGNLGALASSWLDVVSILHEDHDFEFSGLDHAAEYLATNPKYDLAPGLYGNPEALAAELHERLTDQPITTTSAITYVVARPKPTRT